MKSIGWCLDGIQTVMGDIPKTVSSQEDKKKAQDIIDKVQKYADTLAELILHSSFKNDIRQLEEEEDSMEGFRLQAHEIEKLFNDLKHMLYELDLYIQNLREIIDTHPEQWGKKADQLVLMIDQKFGGEMGELRKEFKIAVRTKKRLISIVTYEEHLAELLKSPSRSREFLKNIWRRLF